MAEHDGLIEDYPEHAKLMAIAQFSQAIGEFLDWLPTVGIHLAEMLDSDDDYTHPHLVPTSRSITDLLALYFDIDQARIETEKRQMLAALRGDQ